MHCLNLSKYMHLLLGLWIAFSISICSFNTLFTKKLFWQLLYKYINSSEIKTLTVFNLFFANNSIWSSYFFSSLILDLHFLIPAVIAKFSNPTVRLAVAKKMSVHKARTEIETQLLIAETKISDCSIQFEIVQGLFNSIGL